MSPSPLTALTNHDTENSPNVWDSTNLWGVPGESARPGPVQLGLGWFPYDQFTAALQTWPHLADGWGTTDHREYNHQLQRHLTKLTELDSALGPVWIVPIHLEPFRTWCDNSDHDPATARSAYAADQTRTHAADLIAWPPTRNAACWCASGREYKNAAATPPPASHDQSRKVRQNPFR